jgi:hypothetical protein
MLHYQECYLSQALKELGLNYKAIKCSHKEGLAEVKFGLIFPISLISLCRGMWSENRRREYFFQGLITKKRSWINEVDGVSIVSTSHGRERKREEPDLEYYRRMASFEFVLCPIGDCQWTYRFFEAIMCGAIPVVNHVPHEQESKFHFLKLEQKPHVYDLDKTRKNLNLLIKYHTLQPQKKL